MKRAGGGFDASYNALTAVDDTSHIIVAAEVGNIAADVGQLLPMLQAVKDNIGHSRPGEMLASCGQSTHCPGSANCCRPHAWGVVYFRAPFEGLLAAHAGPSVVSQPADVHA